MHHLRENPGIYKWQGVLLLRVLMEEGAIWKVCLLAEKRTLLWEDGNSSIVSKSFPKSDLPGWPQSDHLLRRKSSEQQEEIRLLENWKVKLAPYFTWGSHPLSPMKTGVLKDMHLVPCSVVQQTLGQKLESWAQPKNSWHFPRCHWTETWGRFLFTLSAQ